MDQNLPAPQETSGHDPKQSNKASALRVKNLWLFIIGSVGFCLNLAVALFIGPQFRRMYESLNIEQLPFMTQVILSPWPAILLLLLAFSASVSTFIAGKPTVAHRINIIYVLLSVVAIFLSVIALFLPLEGTVSRIQ
jgi:hypothetical protein